MHLQTACRSEMITYKTIRLFFCEVHFMAVLIQYDSFYASFIYFVCLLTCFQFKIAVVGLI